MSHPIDPREPKLHPGDMADCNCNTGQEHGAKRAEAQKAWDAWYDSLSLPLLVCPACAGIANSFHDKDCGR